MSPSCSNTASACRSVWRLTESFAASACSPGSFRCPSAYHCGSAARSLCTSCSYFGVIGIHLLCCLYCITGAGRGAGRICSFSLEPPAAGRKKSCLFADKLKIFQKYFGNFQTDRGKFLTDTTETPSFCPERTSRRFPCPTPGSGRNQTKQAKKPEKNKMFRARSRGRPEKLSVSGREASKAVCALRRICAGTCSSD